ncbi:MAG TPA: hypothetical protein VGQ36_25530 [Thermoanaerobaculia bacterium]|nr:hypothetical protein [Thermoanaerobaculia bacterium]
MSANPGDDLAGLLALWREHHGRRATGGWWSLSGFSYQAAAFLARFFQRVEQEALEPGGMAEMESISDIVCPTDGLLRLIQVKRTLDLKAMRAFLEEAYLLTELCRKKIPRLLPRLCFQVACRTRATAHHPADVPMTEVLVDGDETCWREMIERIDPITPVLQERDPLDELSVVFWNAGIRDPTTLLDRLLGRLLSGFLAEPPEATRSIGRDLWSIYLSAERRREWSPVGRVLTSAHVQLDPDAADNRKVLAGQTPKIEHLRKGFFRDRPAMLKAVRTSLEHWLNRVGSDELIGKVPVFWIAGRSGEGKSVLQLQLISELLLSATGPSILQVTPGEVADLLALSSKWPPPEGSAGRPLVVVDDIYDQHDREAWEQAVREACMLATPPIGLLTCGPTEQLEQFSSRLPEVFEITSFVLPPLNAVELEEFVAWYEARSDRPLDPASLTRENPLLVQLVFELAQGVRMPEFALRFGRRLKSFGVYEAARTIVAGTALYLDAPLGLIAEPSLRDELERLCREDQLHFRIDDNPPGGVRLAHPHLAWLLFQEWVGPPETLEKALAREIHQIVETRARDVAEPLPFAPIRTILTSTHLGTIADSESIRIADRKNVIREFYRLHLGTHGGHPDSRALTRWLELEATVAGLDLIPAPSSEAVRAMENESTARMLHGSVAGLLWLLGENALENGIALKDAAERFFFAMPENPGLVQALKTLLARSRQPEKARRIVFAWLTVNSRRPPAYLVIAPLVARSPANADIFLRATEWLDSNALHPNAYDLLVSLVAGNPSDAVLRERAMQWLDTNGSHPNAYLLLATLVAWNPSSTDVHERTTQWLEANGSHPNAHYPLAASVAGNPSDADIRALATQWLDTNASHPNAHYLLAALVAGNRLDPDVRERATQWLDANRSHLQAHELLRTLIAANPLDTDLRNRATQWLDANTSHPQAYQLLVSLIAANPLDTDLGNRATQWLDANTSHPQAYKLLATLITANPLDADLGNRATQWLDVNTSHPQAHDLLRSSIATNPLDAGVVERARQWLDRQDVTASSRYELLRTLIARSNGDAEWLLRGVNYVRAFNALHPEQILAVLLTAGKAAAQYIDMALAYAGRPEARSHRGFLLKNLGKAAVANSSAAASYLRGPADDYRKRAVRDSIVYAIRRDSDSHATLECLHVLAKEIPDQIHRLLLKSIELDIQTEGMDAFIARWLGDNYHRAGYAPVLRSIVSRSNLLSRLQGRDDITPAVAHDLSERCLKPPAPSTSSKIPVKVPTTPPATLPKAGDLVVAELLAERTKKGGWRARHPVSGLAGPIQNSAMVPSEHQPGDHVTLVVRMATERVIAFAWAP